MARRRLLFLLLDLHLRSMLPLVVRHFHVAQRRPRSLLIFWPALFLHRLLSFIISLEHLFALPVLLFLLSCCCNVSARQLHRQHSLLKLLELQTHLFHCLRFAHLQVSLALVELRLHVCLPLLLRLKLLLMLRHV